MILKGLFTGLQGVLANAIYLSQLTGCMEFSTVSLSHSRHVLTYTDMLHKAL